MVSPVSVQVVARPSAVAVVSPLRIVMLVPREVGVTAAASEIVDVPDDATATAQLGAATKARTWYDVIESVANVHVAAIPYTTDADAVTNRTNAVNALNTALGSSVELAKVNNAIDLLLVPELTREAIAQRNPITAALDTHVAALGVLALIDAREDGYANARAWATLNRGLGILPVSNHSDTTHENGVAGSVILAAHIAYYSGVDGIDAHPFTLDKPCAEASTTLPRSTSSLAPTGRPMRSSLGRTS